MDEQHLFGGSALSAVDAAGVTTVPPFVRRTWERRSGGGPTLVGMHEALPCLRVFDAAHARRVHLDLERRRLRDESYGLEADGHYGRTLRAFGLTEEAASDGRGRVRLPALLRHRGGIGAAALWVGAGDAVELWDPEQAASSDDETLREIAAWRLDEGVSEEDETWD